MGLFSSNKTVVDAATNDNSVNMADQAVYVGAGATSASGGGIISHGPTTVDNSIHQALDAELAGTAFETIAGLAGAGRGLSDSDRAMQNAAMGAAGGPNRTTLYIIGAVLAAGIGAALLFIKPRK
jgi:hypothetical protein